MKNPQTWQIGIILTIGVLAVSITAILIRLAIDAAEVSGIGFSLFLAASRLSLSALIILPAWKSLKQVQSSPRSYYYAIAAGCCLALHFAAWITSLSFTSIAASTTLVTTNPVWVSLLCWWWFKEKLSLQTILGICIALIGSFLIAFGDIHPELGYSNPLLGDLLSLFGAILVSLYFLFGREAQRQGFTITNYIAVAYSSAAVMLLPLPLLFNTAYTGYPHQVYIYVLLMAVFSQIIGHTSFNWSLRWLSPTIVTLAILFEPVVASLLGWVIFAEIPAMWVIFGGIVVLIGVNVAVLGNKNNP
jgi:drug/metabolite transporter (DMT)-like permease